MHNTLTRSSNSWKLGAWCAALLTALALLCAPLPAHAHDVLVESTPEIGSELDTTPSEIRLRFSGQPLDGQGLQNLIRVTDAQGNQWQDAALTVTGFELVVPLCENLPQGDYTVAYRVIYSDGHTGEESFSFTNADPTAATSGVPENCGVAQAPDTTGQVPEDPAASSAPAPDISDADSQAEQDQHDTTSSVPTWIWWVGGLGILIVAGIVFLLLRGSRAEGPSADGHDE